MQKIVPASKFIFVILIIFVS